MATFIYDHLHAIGDPRNEGRPTICPACTILNISADPIDHHFQLFFCSYGCGGREGAFKDFCNQIRYRNICCYTCGTPSDIGPLYDEAQHKPCKSYLALDWFRLIAYLVYHIPELRDAVFPFIGIDPRDFGSLDRYVTWLGMRGSRPRFSHLMEIVSAYYLLLSEDRLTTQQLELPAPFRQ